MANPNHQEEEKHNRRGRTTKTKKIIAGRAEAQSAKRQTPTTTANHNLRQTPNAADESPKALAKATPTATTKQRAERQEQPNAPLQQTQHCHVLHRRGRGEGAARREHTLSVAPGVHPMPWSLTQPNGARPGGQENVQCNEHK